MTGPADAWWRSAVIYQVYLRSFTDGSGDGIGDIAGIRERLPYLAGLGVDAIWINPWYPSPMADGGYDVADYRGVDPLFGTLDDATALIAQAHEHGLRVLLDLVPNHSSDRHPWFQAALAAGPRSPERSRYVFRPGRADGPPNDWRSVFGGPAWTQVDDGEWYLHLFASEQPDLDWTSQEVHDDFERTLRFWFDRDVDGFRIDVAHALVKAPGLPDLGANRAHGRPDHPHWDREEVHEVLRDWRKIADSYDPPRVFVAEAWVGSPQRLARYVRADELHTAFNFDFLRAPWLAPELRATIDATLAAHGGVGAPPTWVLSNHDVARHLSRYAREQDPRRGYSLQDLVGVPADLDVGLRRARAAALLMLALPGGAYVYQGEELGLEEVEDLPEELLQDPTWTRSEHTERGRDGCRVPVPWGGTRSPFRFGPEGTTPWLPQPASWAAKTVEAEAGKAGSVLELYRAALRLRREHPALGDGALRWADSGAAVLHLQRDPGFICLVNLADADVPLPAGTDVLLASGPVEGVVPPDTAVWLVDVSS
ncbi:MAG: glycoside hydrolase family 13 protein [Actinobacteria bacterium]|nr:glycoside hydrolase family 13 protein [Actinomycetota bacterium]